MWNIFTVSTTSHHFHLVPSRRRLPWISFSKCITLHVSMTMGFSQVIVCFAFFVLSAWAARIKNAAACIDPQSALRLSGQYCGQGESTTFTATGTSTIEQQCFTKSGNPVQGQPKKSTTPFSVDSLFDPEGTGCENFCFTTEPPASLNCGPAQEPRVLSASYSGVTLVGSNAPSPARLGTIDTPCAQESC